MLAGPDLSFRSNRPWIDRIGHVSTVLATDDLFMIQTMPGFFLGRITTQAFVLLHVLATILFLRLLLAHGCWSRSRFILSTSSGVASRTLPLSLIHIPVPVLSRFGPAAYQSSITFIQSARQSLQTRRV